MEKRVLFRSTWLPWLLLAPQLLVVLVFFFWPASQALVQSLQLQDTFGSHTEWVGLDNFRRLFNDPLYAASFQTTAFFSVLVAGLGISLSLLLAVFADRIIKGALAYKSLLILPYAVAPAVAAVLWVFMLAIAGNRFYFLQKLLNLIKILAHKFYCTPVIILVTTACFNHICVIIKMNVYCFANLSQLITNLDSLSHSLPPVRLQQ